MKRIEINCITNREYWFIYTFTAPNAVIIGRSSLRQIFKTIEFQSVPFNEFISIIILWFCNNKSMNHHEMENLWRCKLKTNMTEREKKQSDTDIIWFIFSWNLLFFSFVSLLQFHSWTSATHVLNWKCDTYKWFPNFFFFFRSPDTMSIDDGV